MFCSKCGANVVEGVAFCGACGQPMAGFSVGQTSAAPVGGAVAVAGRVPVVYAGFWLRVVAAIIDMIVLGFAGWIVTMPFMGAMGMRAVLGGRSPFTPMRPEDVFALMGVFFWMIVIRTVLQWLYFALFESSAWQATLGKKALGLEVTDLGAGRIGFARATGRYFGKYISTIILFIGFMMAGFTEKKQALHDMMAGTLVIRRV